MNLTSLERLDWADAAACTGADPELFFPDGGSPQAVRRQVVDARELCGWCPVRRKCAAHALRTSSDYGIWAGVYLGSHSNERRIAREQLRAISGMEPPNRVGRKPKQPFTCSGTCGRKLRPIGHGADEFPGTLTHAGLGMCASCRRAKRKAAA